MSKKASLNMLRNLIFFIILIFLTFLLIFKDQDINELYNIIKSADSLFILLGIAAMFMYFFMEAYNVKCLLKVFGNKISIFSALKFTWIGFFFSSITPAASGGQPVEIYYMTKEKVSGANATMALLIQLCAFQIGTIAIAIICAILNPMILQGGLIWLFLFGVLANGLVLSIMLICIFSKRLTKKVVNLFMKIFKLFRINNLDKKKEKIEEGLERYNKSSMFIKEHKGEFIKAIIRVLIQICFYFSVPFFVYKAFGLDSYNIFQIFTRQAILFIMVSGIPLPGAIGVSETVFLSIFEEVFGKSLICGSMVLSRGITFYFYVLVSLGVVIVNAMLMKNVKGEIDEKVIEFEKEKKVIV